MFRIAAILITALVTVTAGSAQSGSGFTGAWRLNPARSEINSLPTPPDPVLVVAQSDTAVTLSAGPQDTGPFTIYSYPLPSGAPNSQIEKRQINGSTIAVSTKWEGGSLLVTSVVSGPQNYTVMDHWRESRDQTTLTIHRTIVRKGGETESNLVYEKVGAPKPAAPELSSRVPRQIPPPSAALPERPASVPSAPNEYIVDAGTRILLRLASSVNTKQAQPGDRVHLETAYPVASKGEIVIPAGSYVTGTVLESARGGRVKGRPSLNLRFDTLTLPNGTSRDFRSLPGNVDGHGDVTAKEGKIQGDGKNDTGNDTRTVAQTTAAGAGIGTIAGAATGHYGLGAGIGAAAGAAAGLAGVLMSHNQDVILPRGSTMELVLDRELRFTAQEIR